MEWTNNLETAADWHHVQQQLMTYVIYLQASVESLDCCNILSLLQEPFYSPSPLIVCVHVMLCAAFLCWLLSVIMHNYSQVDRLWSVLPAVYAWIYYNHAYFKTGGHFSGHNSRILVMTGLVTAWGMTIIYKYIYLSIYIYI